MDNGPLRWQRHITVTGSGQSYVFGDYATMQIDGQALGIADPFQALRRAGGHSDQIGSVNTALGGNDIINVNNVNSTDIVIGGAGDDRIFLAPAARISFSATTARSTTLIMRRRRLRSHLDRVPIDPRMAATT